MIMNNACKRHKKENCYSCLKLAVDELLYYTLSSDNGGFVSGFGPILFGKLCDLTNYDPSKREVNALTCHSKIIVE